MISERLALMLEEAERRVQGRSVICYGDPDCMTKEQVAASINRRRDEMIAEEMDRMLRAL